MRKTAIAAVAVLLLPSILPGLAPFSAAADTRNTVIVSPANNADVSGVVTIQVLVLTCNCSNVTALYVDGVFISNGTPGGSKLMNGEYYEQFTHKWDSSAAKRGKHRISVTGKHAEFADTIYVYTGKRSYSSSAFALMTGAVVMVTVIATAALVFRRRKFKQ